MLIKRAAKVAESQFIWSILVKKWKIATEVHCLAFLCLFSLVVNNDLPYFSQFASVLLIFLSWNCLKLSIYRVSNLSKRMVILRWGTVKLSLLIRAILDSQLDCTNFCWNGLRRLPVIQGKHSVAENLPAKLVTNLI